MNIENSVLKFGKYNGKTFKHVLEKDIEYCKWFLTNLDYKNVNIERKQFFDFLKIYT